MIRCTLSAKVPSATTPKTRTASAVPTISATNTSPVLRKEEVTRQSRTNRAQPSGNAPKLARMVVIASFEPSVMLLAAAASTGCPMNLRLIKASTVSAAKSTARLIQGVIRPDIVIAPEGDGLREVDDRAINRRREIHGSAKPIATPTGRC